MKRKINAKSSKHLLWQVSIVYNFFEHVDQVVELTMNVAYNDDWLLHPQNVWLFL